MQKQIFLEEKRELKKDINSLGKTLILYTLSLVCSMILFLFGILIPIYRKYNGNDELIQKLGDKSIDAMMNGGWVYIVGVLIGLLFIIRYRKKRNFINDLTETNRKMSLNTFFKLLVIFMAPQLIFMGAENIIEAGFNSIGYSILGQIEDMSGTSETISMFIYAGIIGPISEELVYRGAVIGSMQKYGKGFAIVISSVLFGIMHGNLIQAVFATIVGLILGYIRVEYSIKWSILIHIINNITADVINLVVERVGEPTGDILLYGIFGVFFILGVLVLYKNKDDVKNYIQLNKPEKKYLKYTLTRFWLFIFILINTLMAIGGIEKIQ